MKTLHPEVKRLLAAAVGAGMALLAVAALVDGAQRLSAGEGFGGSFLRQPLLHARAALALTGLVAPPDAPVMPTTRTPTRW